MKSSMIWIAVLLTQSQPASGEAPPGAAQAGGKTLDHVTLTLDRKVMAGEAMENSFSLSGTDWRIHDDTDGKGAEQLLLETDASTPGWIPATVPGNIQADLEAAHLLKPLWYGAGDPRLADVARKDWWYRKDFTVPQSFAGKRVKLVFDGVDHECEVWLNGARIGGHAGMYRQVGYEVCPALRPDQVNRLAVRIARMPPSLDRHIGMPSQIKVYRHELGEIKCPSFGLDWGIGVYPLGIWKDVRLEASGSARIDHVRVQTKLDAPWRKATVVVRLEVDSEKQLAAQAHFRIEGHGAGCFTDVAATLSAGFNQIEASLELDQPALWWPNGQGEQPLYQLVSELVGAEGKILHSRTTRFGVRDIRWVPVEGAPYDAFVRSQLVVNGRKVRLLGTNIIPADLLPGRQHAKADWLLRMAHAAGMNVVRNWGGGVTMRDGWYDLADELGIMIQQEMPATNSGEPWPAEYSGYTAAMERTAVSIVKQLRNHPCIVEWTGGNEMGWPGDDSPIPTMLRKLVAEMDGRIFRVTDPVPGWGHGNYDDGRTFRATNPAPGWKHGPYDVSPDEFYRNHSGIPAVRCDEFGAPGPANLETWHRDIPPASQWPLRPDDSLLRIKKVFGIFGENGWLQLHNIKAQFGLLPDLAAVIKAGQWISADELRYAIDGIRRGGLRTSGFMNWVFNEPWTNGAGNTVVDYDGRPLMNYYLAKQALTPISLSLKFDSLRYQPDEGLKFEVWLTSDAPAAATGLSWRILARDRNGKVIGSWQGKAEIDPLQAKRLDAISLAIPAQVAQGPVLVETQLLDSGGAILQERVQAFGCGSLLAPFRGLLAAPPSPAAIVTDDARLDAMPNLAAVANGAKSATATSSRTELYHQPTGINDGKYGNEASWIPVAPKSAFQIELRETAAVNRFRLSRDRNGQFKDRWVDYLKIECSQDGSQWHTAFEKSGIRRLPDFSPECVMTIRIDPIPARFVRVTVEALLPETGEFPCIDEFEIFATGQGPGAMPPVSFRTAGSNESRPVARTTLEVSPLPTHVEEGQEILGLRVRNTGNMTALFCLPHPLIEYRTDLFIENGECFIPPGESRTITIRADVRSGGGLSLAQTGWRFSCWNAEDVVVEPVDDVLLAVGRRDRMCREYLGYFDTNKDVKQATLEGTRPDPPPLSCLLDSNHAVRFEFPLSDAQAEHAARLRIHTADQAKEAPTKVAVTLNGRRMDGSLPAGLGIQRVDPAHLAFPATVEFQIPAAGLRPGKNILEVRVPDDGWFSWDAMDLTSNQKGKE